MKLRTITNTTEVDVALQSDLEALAARVAAIEAGQAPPVEPVPEPEPKPTPEPEPEPEPPGGDHPHPVPGGFLDIHHDRVPDFGANPTHVVTQDVRWSELQGLGHHSVIRVETGATLLYDGGESHVHTVAVHGEFRFVREADSKLCVQDLLTYADGFTDIGTQEDPITGSAELSICGDAIDLANDPAQIGNGLITLGKLRICGKTVLHMATVADNPATGDTTLSVETDWQPGDRLVIPDTRQIAYDSSNPTFVSQAEEVEVASNNGVTVTLAAPLEHDHDGPFLITVAKLNRNVVVRSSDLDDVKKRGHAISIGRADVDVQFAEFRGLGRTLPSIQPMVDSPKYAEDGSVIEHADNHIGRYAFHFHHVAGPVNPTNTGFQGRVSGCVFTDWHMWGLVLHDTHYVQIEDNVFYGGMGDNVGVYHDQAASALVTEAGNEIGNSIRRNFICHSRAGSEQRIFGGHGHSIGGSYGRIVDTGRSGIWLGSFGNEVSENVVTNCPDFGIIYTAYKHRGKKRIPLFRGADMHDDSQVEIVRDLSSPLDANNEVYGATGDGVWLAYQGRNDERSVLHGWKLWHITRAPVYDWGMTAGVTYRDTEIVGDPKVSALSVINGRHASAGMSFGDTYYHNQGLRLENVRISGYPIGIRLPHRCQRELIVMDGLWLKNYINIEYRPPRFERELQLELKNVTFEPSEMTTVNRELPPACDVWCHLDQSDPHTILTHSTRLTVNGQQIYFREQAADFVIPPYRTGRGGIQDDAPGVGMTNAQALAELGICIGGEIAPFHAVDGAPDIQGLVVRA